MNSKTLLLVSILVPCVIVGVGLLKPELVLDDDGLSVSVVWSFIGTFISYLGFVFSLFALLEVRSLSNRYFAKRRLPEIKKKLEVIANRMTESGGLELVKIRTERFLGEITVLVKEIRKTKVSDFSPTVKLVIAHHGDLEKSLRDDTSLEKTANDVEAYWSLLRAVTQLADEIDQQHAGDLARL